MGYQPDSQTQAAVSPVSQPIAEVKDIVAYFQAGCKKPEDVKIGMEVEKHGIHGADYHPVTYSEEKGVRKVQDKLIEELNWQVERQEDRYITAIGRGGSRFTLEYGESMTELSGRTHPSIHDLARELRIHMHELSEMSKLVDVIWLGIGYQPFHEAGECKRVKIGRFDILEKFFKRVPNWRAHWSHMASVQANIDYVSEEDARKKFQILMRLGPFLSAMYAHSPIKEGKNTGFVSYRTHLLHHMDRRRFGARKIFFSPHFGFEKWIDFCMKIPMVAIFRQGQWMPVKRMTFTQFLKAGYEGHAPTIDDWILHMSFIYSDVRMRQFIELRIIDSLPPFLIPSLQAIVKAFVYHPDGEKALKDLTKGWTFRDFTTIYGDIAVRGLKAELRGIKMLEYCKKILDIATANLRSLAVLNEKGEDESVYLERIKEFVFVKERSPGEWVQENWDGEWRQSPERLIDWCGYTAEILNNHV